LTSECLIDDADKVKFDGGKIYLPPVFDPDDNKLHFFSGYGDTPLAHESIKTNHLICYCHPGMNSFGYRSHENPNFINVQFPPIPSAQKHATNKLSDFQLINENDDGNSIISQSKYEAMQTGRNSNNLNQSAVYINAGIGGGIATGPPKHQNTNNKLGTNSSVDRNLFPINVYTPDKYVKKAYM
jgi:hypothetical protein